MDATKPYDDSPRTDGSVHRKNPRKRDLRFKQMCPEKLYLGTLGWRYANWRGIVYDDYCPEYMHWDSSLQAYADFPLVKALRWLPTSNPQFLDSQWRTMRRILPANLKLWVRAPGSVCDPCRRGRFGKKRGENTHFLNASKALMEWVGPARQHFPSELAGVILDVLNDQTPGYLAKEEQRKAFYEKLRLFLTSIQQNKHLSTRVFVSVRNRKVYTPTLMKILYRTHCYPLVTIATHTPSLSSQLRALEYYFSLWNDSVEHIPIVFRWLNTLLPNLIRKQTIPHDPVTRATLIHRMKQKLAKGHEVTCLVHNAAEGNAALTLQNLAQLWMDATAS